MVLVASSHFVSFFLGLEILSVALYALSAYLHTRSRPLEAGIKYLILAGSSSAFLLFGMALIYAQTGTKELFRLPALLAGGQNSRLVLAGLTFMVTGIGFKLGVVPFHLWTPDVYEGAPAPVTAFIATVSKGAIFALLLRYFYTAVAQHLQPILVPFAIIAIASMLIGTCWHCCRPTSKGFWLTRPLRIWATCWSPLKRGEYEGWGLSQDVNAVYFTARLLGARHEQRRLWAYRSEDRLTHPSHFGYDPFLGFSTTAAMNRPGSDFAPLSQVIGPSPNIFAPASAPAHDIFRLSMFVLAITSVIFLVVSGLLLYVILRYRQRSDDNHHEPAQVYGSNQIELSWTVIPVLIVMVLFLTTVRVILDIEHTREPVNALNVIAIGHQFWWEFRYPQYGIVTANELHVPVSNEPKSPTPTYLKLLTTDVNHSFWVPRLAGKTDLIANRVNTMWIQPETAGLYLGQCAEYCGLQHAHMLLRVYVQSPADFEQWVEQQQQRAVQDSSVAEGRAIFQKNACINCHTIAGTEATGHFGPDLTHLMSRDTIASGALPNTRDNLQKWIENPDSLKPGALMPAMKLDNHDLNAVTSYLMTLH